MKGQEWLKKIEKSESVFSRRSRARSLQIGVRGETAQKMIGQIQPGCEIFGFTKGQFCIINVIEHVLDQVGASDVVICTWSAASGDIRAANRMLSLKKIKTLRFIVDFSFQSRKPEFCNELIREFGADAIRVTSCHAKFVLIKSKDYNIVIRTSMNLNYNPRFENFEISDDALFYDFMSKIVNEIWETQDSYKGFINKPYDNKQCFNGLFSGSNLNNSAGIADLTSAEI